MRRGIAGKQIQPEMHAKEREFISVDFRSFPAENLSPQNGDVCNEKATPVPAGGSILAFRPRLLLPGVFDLANQLL
jgi:hypothetical protein